MVSKLIVGLCAAEGCEERMFDGPFCVDCHHKFVRPYLIDLEWKLKELVDNLPKCEEPDCTNPASCMNGVRYSCEEHPIHPSKFKWLDYAEVLQRITMP